MLITGVDYMEGNYQGHDFKNYYLYSESPANVSGKRYKTYKIKKDVLENFMEKNLIDKASRLVGLDLEFYRDDYRKITLIQIITKK